jgi:hypothetical protein
LNFRTAICGGVFIAEMPRERDNAALERRQRELGGKQGTSLISETGMTVFRRSAR